MAGDRWKWRDPPTGRRWFITGHRVPGEPLVRQLVFPSREEGFEVCHVSNRGVDAFTDRETLGIIQRSTNRERTRCP